MGEFKVHRVRFFDYMPSAIRAMALCRRSERLALARADGALEIFNFADNYFQEKVRAPEEVKAFYSSGELSTLYKELNSALYSQTSYCKCHRVVFCWAATNDSLQMIGL